MVNFNTGYISLPVSNGLDSTTYFFNQVVNWSQVPRAQQRWSIRWPSINLFQIWPIMRTYARRSSLIILSVISKQGYILRQNHHYVPKPLFFFKTKVVANGPFMIQLNSSPNHQHTFVAQRRLLTTKKRRGLYYSKESCH